MKAFSGDTRSKNFFSSLWSQRDYWLLPVVLGAVLPLIIYGLLPLLGITIFKALFEPKIVLILFFLALFMVAYSVFCFITVRNPEINLYLITFFAPALFYISLLPSLVGIMSLLTVKGMVKIVQPFIVPILLCLVFYGRNLITKLPHFKYYCFFTLCAVFYYYFYNANILDPVYFSLTGRALTVSISMIASLLYAFFGFMFAGSSMFRGSKSKQIFDIFNLILVSFSLLDSLITVLGFPVGKFSIVVDGFLRASSRIGHPNAFAHRTGIIIVYLVGIYLYYRAINEPKRKSLVPLPLIITCLIFSLIAFLLALSKTGLALMTLCSIVFFLLSFPFMPANEKLNSLRVAPLLLVLPPILLIAYQLISGTSFLDILQSRVEDTSSYVWRQEIWDIVLSGINGQTIFIGNGLTSANEKIYDLTFRPIGNKVPLILVHNGYIQMIYDFGLLGMSLFVAVFSMIFNSLLKLFRSAKERIRPLMVATIVICLYFLGATANDEMIFMFDGAFLFWVLTALLFSMGVQEQSEAKTEGV